MGVEGGGGSTASFGEMIARTHAQMGQIIRRAGIRME
jgi:hypothetical protein